LFIILLLSVLSSAQDLEVQSLGVGGGLLLPQGDWNSGFYIELQTELGEILDYIFLSPYFDYMSSKRSEETSKETYNLSLNYFSFGSKIIGYINSKPRGFYLGGSLSFNIISSDAVDYQSADENLYIKRSNDTKIGLAPVAGYLFKLKTVSITIESRYTLIQGGFNAFQIGVGFNYNL
jgi:hypothetical protein